MDISSGQKPVYFVKILVSEQIAVTVVLYFGQVFIFRRLIKLRVLEWFLLQSNLCITTTWGTKFLWSLQTGGRHREALHKTTKTVNSDIWLLYKGSTIFHLITHDRYWQK